MAPRSWPGLELPQEKSPPGLVAPRETGDAPRPTNLRQDRGQSHRAMPPPGTVDQQQGGFGGGSDGKEGGQWTTAGGFEDLSDVCANEAGAAETSLQTIACNRQRKYSVLHPARIETIVHALC